MNKIRKGFTIGEAVIVLIILVILALMLMPSVNTQRGYSKRLACMNNSTGLFESMIAYRTEFGGIWPKPEILEVNQKTGEVIYDSKFVGPNNFSLQADVTVSIFHALAKDLELNPRIFNSPARDDWLKIELVEANDNVSAQGIREWGGTGDNIKIDYMLDWSAPKSSGSMRPLIANRDPGLHEDRVNVIFADGHGESLVYDSEIDKVIHDFVAEDEDIYTHIGDELDGKPRHHLWGKGHKKRAHMK